MNRIQDLSRGWSRLIFLPAGLVGGYVEYLWKHSNMTKNAPCFLKDSEIRDIFLIMTDYQVKCNRINDKIYKANQVWKPRRLLCFVPGDILSHTSDYLNGFQYIFWTSVLLSIIILCEYFIYKVSYNDNAEKDVYDIWWKVKFDWY